MRLSISKVIVVLGVAALVGCRSIPVPVENVPQTTIVQPTNRTLSAEQVRAAIVRAGAGLGWQINDAGPGRLTGSIVLRDHSAQIEIPYSAQSYAITYKSSTNLNASQGMIHRNYNGWIQNLNRAIRAQLATI